jgi:hypothetical protein
LVAERASKLKKMHLEEEIRKKRLVAELLPKLLLKQNRRNWLHKPPLLIGRDRLRRLQLNHNVCRLLLLPISKPKRLSSRQKEQDK